MALNREEEVLAEAHGILVSKQEVRELPGVLNPVGSPEKRTKALASGS